MLATHQVHDALMSAGWDANTSAYYAEIDRRVAAAFPAQWQEYMGLVRRGTWHQAPELPGPEAAAGGMAAEGQELPAGEADGQLHSGRVSRQSGVLGNGQEEGDDWQGAAAAAASGGTSGKAAGAGVPAGAGASAKPPVTRGKRPAGAVTAAAAVDVPPLKIYAARAQAASTAQRPGGLMTPAVQAALPRHMQYRPAAIAPGGITDHIFGELGGPAAGPQQKQGAGGALAASGRLATPLLLPSDTPSPPGGSPAASPQQYSGGGSMLSSGAAGGRPEFSVSAYQGQQALGAGQQLAQSLRRGAALSELSPLELQVGNLGCGFAQQPVFAPAHQTASQPCSLKATAECMPSLAAC
jgi:hypothetical protein